MSVNVPAASEPSAGRMIFTLGLAGLLSGLVLVGVYEATLPRITANEARALREAVFQVVPGSSRMQALILSGDRLEPVEEFDPNDPSIVFGAYGDAGSLVGYAIPGEGAGFQDVIKLINRACGQGLKRLRNHLRDPPEGDSLVQERGHRLLVGRVENRSG